jgi:transposase
MKTRKPYPTDLNDRQWQMLQPLLPGAKPGGRPDTYPKREILNGIFYVVEAVLPGVRSLMIYRLTALSIAIFVHGVSMAPGLISMRS